MKSRKNCLRWIPISARLIGDGPLRPQIEAGVAAAGLKDQFILTGVRADVPQILERWMFFCFPRNMKGCLSR